MNAVTGDIWKLATKHDAVVVPVNIGWKQNGLGVLGAGLARAAARRFQWLAGAWGAYCQSEREEAAPVSWRVDSKWCRYLILFPTKPLDEEKPWLSWRADASLGLIEQGLPLLVTVALAIGRYAERHSEPKPLVLVPSLGCGHGNLQEKDVLPLLQKWLVHPCFTHVKRDADA